jgi:hypothetical protein
VHPLVKLASWIGCGLLAAGLVLLIRPSSEAKSVDDTTANIQVLREDGNAEGLGAVAAGPDMVASRRALDALGFMGVEAVPQIRVALKDSRAEVRTRAASALGHAGDPVHAKPLAERMTDKDEHVDVRLAATVAIGRMHGYPHLNDLLDAMIADPESKIRRAALNAYKEITGYEMPFDVSGNETTRREQVKMMRGIIPLVQDIYSKKANAGRREGNRVRSRHQTKPLPSEKNKNKPRN